MAEIAIDRLSLKLSGLTAGDGERLARLVAGSLGRQTLPDGSGREVEGMSVKIAAASGNLNQLSDQIVREIMRQLAN